MSFSPLESINFGWSKARGNVLMFVKYGIIYYVIVFLVAAFTSNFLSNNLPVFILVQIGVFILSLFFQLWLAKLSLVIADGGTISLTELYRSISWRLVVRLFVAFIMLDLILVGVGFIVAALFFGVLYLFPNSLIADSVVIALGLLIASYVAIRLNFLAYAIIDQDLTSRQALLFSYQITKGHVLKLVIFSLLLALVLLGGFLLIVIGLLWAIPTVFVATAYVYRQLAAASSSSTQPAVSSEPATQS